MINSTPERGGIWISLTIFLFIVSLIAVGGIGWLLWEDTGQSPSALQTLLLHQTLPQTPTPLPTIDTLRPMVNIAPVVSGDTTELENKLVAPLRAFYATKAERLGTITVEPATTDNHSLQVTYEVTTTTGLTKHTFFYDRAGENQTGPYPTWGPSLLDHTQ